MGLTSASIRLNFSATVPIGNSGAFGSLSPNIDLNPQFGPAATNVADTAYVAGITVTTSPTTIDLSGGTITQPGDAGVASFSKIKGLLIQNAHASANLLINKTGSANAGDFQGTFGPSAFIVICDPVNGQTVTNSTADKLTLASSTGSVPVNIWIIGPA